MIRKLLFAIPLLLLSCKKEKLPIQAKPIPFYKPAITPQDRKTITREEARTYHEDKKYHYEYRTGTSGHYEYNYDVRGYDADGNEVTGNINIEGKFGAGILDNASGEEVEIQAEWTGYGKLRATDKDGNTYELEVIQ